MEEVIAQTIAFVVIVIVLWRYVWPPVNRLMENRQEQAARQVADAQDAEKELTEARRKHDSAVSEAEQEASRIRDDARADATRIREETAEQAERDVERIQQRGRERLVAERDAAERGLRAEVGGLSLQLAQRIIAEAMDDDQKRASVDGFLDQLDGFDSASSNGSAAGGSAGDGSAIAGKQPAQTGGGVS